MDAAGDRFGLSGTTLAGRYRVERQVAEGGFAVVYRAVQIALDRPIALKVLKTPPGLTDAARARFEHRFATEARTIGKLQHPYIVDVYDYGVSPMPLGDPAPWMALEWLEGETLEHELDPAPRRGRAQRRGDGDAVATGDRSGRLRAQARRRAPRHQAREHHRSSTRTPVRCCGCWTSASRRSWRGTRSEIRGRDAAAAPPVSRRTTPPPNRSAIRERALGPTCMRSACCSTELLTDEPPFRPPATSSSSNRSCRSAGRPRTARARMLVAARGRRPGACPVAGPALERRRRSARRRRRARRRRGAPAPRVRAASSAPIVDDGDRIAGVAAVAAATGDLAREAAARLAMPVSGGLAILSAFALLVWALRIWWVAPARRFGARHLGRPTFRRGSSRSRPARPRPRPP